MPSRSIHQPSYAVPRRSPRGRGAGLVALLAALATLAAGCGGGDGASAPPTISDVAEHGGTIRIDLGSTFDATLRSLGVTPGSFQDARLTADTPGGTLLFPVDDGRIAPDHTAPAGVSGSLQADHAGFTLTKDDTTLTVGNLVVDLSHSVVYGDVAVGSAVQATHVVLFDLDDRNLRTTTSDDTVVISGGKAYFSLRLAKLLDDTFHAQAVDGDSELGATTFAVERG